MAAYADEAFAVSLYGTDYVTVSHGGDSALFAVQLDVATATINSFLLGKVALPLAVVPIDLQKRCVDLAIYESCPSQGVRTEEKTKRYEAAMSWLRGVRDNKIILSVGEAEAPERATSHLTASPQTVTGAEQVSRVRTGARVYTRDKLKGTLL